MKEKPGTVSNSNSIWTIRVNGGVAANVHLRWTARNTTKYAISKYSVWSEHVRPKRENNHDFIPYIMIEKITHFFVVFFIGHVLSKLSESLLGFLFGADFLR